MVLVAVDGKTVGYLRIADELKPDAAQTIQQLKAKGIKTVVLSGDKDTVTQHFAKMLSLGRSPRRTSCPKTK